MALRAKAGKVDAELQTADHWAANQPKSTMMPVGRASEVCLLISLFSSSQRIVPSVLLPVTDDRPQLSTRRILPD